jgi:hypothetical protein
MQTRYNISMQKKLLLIFGLVALISLAGIYFLNQPKSSQISTQPNIPVGQTHTVVLTENGFQPSEIEIKVGDIVEFKASINEPFWPASDLHPTHGIYPEFDPTEPIEPSDSWPFQFLKNGRWKFHDHLQPIFRGVVIVK